MSNNDFDDTIECHLTYLLTYLHLNVCDPTVPKLKNYRKKGGMKGKEGERVAQDGNGIEMQGAPRN